MSVRLNLDLADYLILILFLLTTVIVGVASRRTVSTSLDQLLAGRAMPAWIAGIAFIAADLGAVEILGMAANGAEYGMMTVHYYWLAGVPAMVFLGIVMMPFYYRSRARSVPEFLRLRFNKPTQGLNAVIFSVAQVLIAGVNLYALALIMRALLGWDLTVSILVSSLFVLTYLTVGGLTAAIYNEVLQFFIILAGLIPITVIGLLSVGGLDGLFSKVRESTELGQAGTTTWSGVGLATENNSMHTNIIALVFGLGFVASFGYFTTNFPQVQRAMAARNTTAARRAPIIGAFPKLLFPFLTVIPGLIALVLIPHLGLPGGSDYNSALPALMQKFLPNGVLGIAVTGLLASFMAGMAANISSFCTVVTYDITQTYLVKNRPDRYYLTVARIVPVIGVILAIGTAFIAASYSNIMNYLQNLFAVFNAPLFATFIIALFWRRMTPWAGFWSLLSGSVAAGGAYLLYSFGMLDFGTPINASFWNAAIAFVASAIAAVTVSMVTEPKPAAELDGLVWRKGLSLSEGGPGEQVYAADRSRLFSPVALGAVALASCVGLYLVM
ncbi:Na+/galactose cotransporter [Mycolicibacterium wolinskyi]|uniref:Na+/galactose cotransporter n=1 Tax=Mycolicibacterium wolinskyi TaxID=59750 RepID=A0A132PUC0_9MYCO|nr:sodium:solute symporter family protein [Mycolicibacterium wolinskyi]KWX25949.1 Na+/galactose cotransporter [Mycolicibacterium wolinskyi]